VKVATSRTGGGTRDTCGRISAPSPITQRSERRELSGVRDGSPQRRAAERRRCIVEFAGQKIANIYDYTYAAGRRAIGRRWRSSCWRRPAPGVKATPEARSEFERPADDQAGRSAVPERVEQGREHLKRVVGRALPANRGGRFAEAAGCGIERQSRGPSSVNGP